MGVHRVCDAVKILIFIYLTTIILKYGLVFEHHIALLGFLVVQFVRSEPLIKPEIPSHRYIAFSIQFYQLGGFREGYGLFLMEQNNKHIQADDGIEFLLWIGRRMVFVASRDADVFFLQDFHIFSKAATQIRNISRKQILTEQVLGRKRQGFPFFCDKAVWIMRIHSKNSKPLL